MFQNKIYSAFAFIKQTEYNSVNEITFNRSPHFYGCFYFVFNDELY
jgi:hypothetical protein